MPALPHYSTPQGGKIAPAEAIEAVAQRPATTKRSRFRFIVETISELRKVVWLSRREVVYLSTLVLIISVAAGIVLGAIDYGFAALVEDVFVGG